MDLELFSYFPVIEAAVTVLKRNHYNITWGGEEATGGQYNYNWVIYWARPSLTSKCNINVKQLLTDNCLVIDEGPLNPKVLGWLTILVTKGKEKNSHNTVRMTKL